jgi:glycosyltransferase involved in cell wall biosynthesis
VASVDNKYSVLMSVYYKEKPEYLQQSIESILNQTVPTDDFVLVCDGPLTPELDAVIEKYNTLHLVRLKENGGLGNALNEGMKYCRHELVARMDSDDISRQDRCERELKAFADHPEVDIVSGTIEEFITSPDEVYSRRVLPETNDEIVEFAKKRNPFNHPAVMYRKSAVEAAGGYKGFYLLEDYFLWIRMILNDCRGYNIQSPVLWMRAGSDLYKRRGGMKYVGSEKRLFSYMLEKGFIDKGQYSRAVIGRAVGAMIPNWVRGILYKKVLRK